MSRAHLQSVVQHDPNLKYDVHKEIDNKCCLTLTPIIEPAPKVDLNASFV